MTSKKTKAPAPGASAPGGVQGALQELQDLYRFMQENGLEAVEVDRKDSHVKLVRRSSRPVAVPFPVLTEGAPAAAAAPSAPAAAGASPLPPNAAVVKAPMMGIFYRAASPSSPPFAKEGDEVKAGDVLCLIEARKVFNDVKAEYAGVVLRVLIENGKPVKVGQDLLIIERK